MAAEVCWGLDIPEAIEFVEEQTSRIEYPHREMFCALIKRVIAVMGENMMLPFRTEIRPGKERNDSVLLADLCFWSVLLARVFVLYRSGNGFVTLKACFPPKTEDIREAVRNPYYRMGDSRSRLYQWLTTSDAWSFGRFYSDAPLLYNDETAFAPWLAASCHITSDKDIDGVTTYMSRYLFYIGNYKRSSKRYRFEGISVSHRGDIQIPENEARWFVLGYSPMREFRGTRKVFLSGFGKNQYIVETADVNVAVYPYRVTEEDAIVMTPTSRVRFDFTPPFRYVRATNPYLVVGWKSIKKFLSTSRLAYDAVLAVARNDIQRTPTPEL